MNDTPRNVTCLALTLFCHAVPAVAAPQDWGAELDRTVDELLETHPEPYHRVSPVDFERAVSELRLSLPELEDHAVVVELMRLVARIGDGHTRYDSENGSHGFARLFPIVTHADADGLHVLAATGEHANLVGARVLRYGETEPPEAIRRVGETVSADNPQGVLRGLPYAMQRPAILHALGITSEPDVLELELEMPGGARQRAVLQAIDRESRAFRREALVFADAGAQRPPPLYLRRAPTRFHWLKHPQPPFHWFQELEGEGVLYAQINRIRDADEGWRPTRAERREASRGSPIWPRRPMLGGRRRR